MASKSSICRCLLGSQTRTSPAGLAPRSGGAAPRRHSPQFRCGAATQSTAIDRRAVPCDSCSTREEMVYRARERRSFADVPSEPIAIIFGSDTMVRVVQTRRFRDAVLLCYFAADVR
jgi:hypothetical protein